jgi:hypothetical protein
MAETNPPMSVQVGGHSAAQERRFWAGLVGDRSGILDAGSFSVGPTAPATMGVVVQAGRGMVMGTENANQGGYPVDAITSETLILDNAHVTVGMNRIDLIIARVLDQEYLTSPTTTFVIEFVKGTTVSGTATPPAAPPNSMILAEVSVLGGSSAISGARITDRRYRATAQGGIVLCTSTSRPPSPYRGMRIMELDTGRNLIYVGATTEWQRDWGVEWGSLAAYYTASTGTVNTDTYQGLGGTGGARTFYAGRRYTMMFTCMLQNTSASVAKAIDFLFGPSSVSPLVALPSQKVEPSAYITYTAVRWWDQVATEWLNPAIYHKEPAGALEISTRTLMINDIGPTPGANWPAA